MKSSRPSILRVTAALSLSMALLCISSPSRAADEPKPDSPSSDALKRQTDELRRTNDALLKVIEEGRRRFEDFEAYKRRLQERLAELEQAARDLEVQAKRGLNKSVKPVPTIPSLVQGSSTLEANAIEFKTPRMHAYEADRHTAEKIEAHVRQADARAMLLLEGGAPSHVLGR